ncbi:efflux transporter outer membrane subunit [Alteraurantiacibacter aquimixticola]|uniref:Efflux transporter outer membrane subunit n=1 Tax=Alteraurantiacibacter aquimixticola TaxID=2489173 RepID=A0A4T3F3A9_9SPHN|nr:efflux transporter outer membrane subunit [Alteraurantiacibacter aquimixticola]
MRRTALPLALALGLAGCARPDIAPPQASFDIPQDWAESDPAPITLDITEYWTLLDDPLLSELVEAAIANNLDLEQSVARLDQSRAQLVQARSSWFPTLTASGGAGRSFLDNDPGDFTFDLGADASWEMDLFGQISGNVAAARADYTAAGYSLADLQRLIVGQVAISAINARSLSQQLEIAKNTLAYQEDNLQIARWRNQAGLVSSLDVEQARTQRAQTAATIPALESSLAATANSISTLIGEPPGRVRNAFMAPEEIPQPVALAGFEAPAEVLRRRPDVRGAEASLYSASARIGVARAQLFPLLRLTGSVGTSSLGIDDLFDIVTGSVFASVSQLIFDGGRTQAQVDSAEAGARAAYAAWEQSVLNALEDVESAAVDQRSARQRVAITEEAVDAATNSAILARSQYQAGLADFRTLLTAENSLLSARNQLVSAEADRASAFVRLTQALGGGWSAEDFPLPASDRTQ